MRTHLVPSRHLVAGLLLAAAAMLASGCEIVDTGSTRVGILFYGSCLRRNADEGVMAPRQPGGSVGF